MPPGSVLQIRDLDPGTLLNPDPQQWNFPYHLSSRALYSSERYRVFESWSIFRHVRFVCLFYFFANKSLVIDFSLLKPLFMSESDTNVNVSVNFTLMYRSEDVTVASMKHVNQWNAHITCFFIGNILDLHRAKSSYPQTYVHLASNFQVLPRCTACSPPVPRPPRSRLSWTDSWWRRCMTTSPASTTQVFRYFTREILVIAV